MLAWLIPLLLALPEVHLVDTTDAQAHIEAASAAATDDIPVTVLLAVAYQETKLNPRKVSRAKGGLFCGIMQAMAKRPGRGYSEARCVELRDLTLGYRVGAEELAYWFKKTGGDLALTFAHHGCGNVATGRRCRAYAGRVLRTMRKLSEPRTTT